MAYIEKRKNSKGKVTYRARVREIGSPDISMTFKTEREATRWSQRMESEIRAGRYFGREEDRERTFAEFIDRYIEKELPKNPIMFAKQKPQLLWWKSQLGKYLLCHITAPMIAEMRDKLLGETTRRHRLRTPSTTNRYIAALSKAFTIGVKEWQWIKENPVQKIIKPRENKARERFLDKEEIQQLLSVCSKSKSPHLFVVTRFALSTGARKGEILGLTWDDIDFTHSTVTFRNTKNKETRSLSLPPQILEMLGTERGKRSVLSEYVFPSMDGKQPADIRVAWDLAIKELGFKDVCFHTLRHTVASHLSMSGYSGLEIGKILGHKSASMVNRYSHFSTESTKAPLDNLYDDMYGAIAVC